MRTSMLYWLTAISMEVFFMRMRCPHCGQKYEIDDDLTGQELECSACGKTFTAAKSDDSPTDAPVPELKPLPVPPESPSASAPQPTRRCPMCGEKILAVARKCRFCGEYLDESGQPLRRKNRTVYVLLGLFLGGFGAHNFYIGQQWRGAIKVVLGVVGAGLMLVDSDISFVGVIIVTINSALVISELIFDPNNKTVQKRILKWQCIVLGCILTSWLIGFIYLLVCVL